MADISSDIESAPIPSIKSLKSRFEQFALDHAAAVPHALPKSTPALPAPTPLQAHTALTSEPAAVPRSKPRPSLTPDHSTPQSQPAAPVCDIRSKGSNPDMKAAALKRAPPPPPPRTKKRLSSPVASPLLRPVPVPAALRSPKTSPKLGPPSVLPDLKNDGSMETDEEGCLAGVASLRNRFCCPTQIQASMSSPLRPTTPRPPRPPMMTSHSDSAAIEHAPPAIPPRHTRPDLSRSSSTGSSAETPSTAVATIDATPRSSNVAAVRGIFASKGASTSQTRDDNPPLHSEPSILITSPPILPARPTRPLNSALFARVDNLDLLSSSNSSHCSPFSDNESEVSEISEVSLSPAAQPQKATGSHSMTHANEMYNLHPERQPSGSSSESLSGFSPASKPRPPPRPVPRAPPRPPRHSNGLHTPLQPHNSSISSSLAPTLTQPVAPPLPSRRVQGDGALDAPSSAPPLPARLASPRNNALIPLDATSPVGERKVLGNARLPPPPTRTIGLGDKLPPMRRPPSPSSDEESASEEDPRVRSVESLPDSSRSSRRPPSMPSANFLEYKIHVPAHSGCVSVAGNAIAVASGQHIKYYDLSSNSGPLWTLDTRDTMRGAIVSCVEFKSSCSKTDVGKFLWVGTKEGHLLEVDVHLGAFTFSKMGLHASQVTHISRHGSAMITADELGKTFVFESNANASVGASSADDVHLVYTAPRLYRLGEKVEFVKLFRGLLWTAVRTDMHGVGTTSVPVVRIYDIYAPGSVGRTVALNQHAGAVTSGTILPSHPDHVYLGHEAGYISIWNVATSDGIPACVDVVKVSTSDVLCLEGVNDRLWAGGRKGTISAYDVSAKPWVVTNCWDAHGGLPVSRIFVDPYSTLNVEKLCVVSVGRDEQIRFWDGLLGADRIEQELLKREHAFSTFRDLKVLVVTWNVDAAKPEALAGDPENVRFLHDVLTCVESPDIISFGFQELIDLESRKMAAKTVLLGGKKKGDEGKINEKVTSSYKRWHDRLIQAVRLAMPPDTPYTVIHTESLVGLFTCMFIKNVERASLKDAAITTIKRGMGGRYGNKGGIAARFVIDDSSLCFINCHLAAGQHHVRQRNADVAAFLEETGVFPTQPIEEGFAYVGGGDGSMVLDHEIVFLNGDMNYRIDQRRDAVVAAIQADELDGLRTHDQLLKEMKHNRAFRLRAFCEGPLTFPPTYKYDRGSNAFDTSEKRRVPAWCDRVLWRSREAKRVALVAYRRWEPNVSDHRPVSAVFQVTVKRVMGEAREKERKALTGWWKGTEVALLSNARAFYLEQAML